MGGQRVDKRIEGSTIWAEKKTGWNILTKNSSVKICSTGKKPQVKGGGLSKRGSFGNNALKRQKIYY